MFIDAAFIDRVKSFPAAVCGMFGQRVRSLRKAEKPALAIEIAAKSASRENVPDRESRDLLRLVKAYVAVVDLDARRDFKSLEDRFAYEAAIVLHHAHRKLTAEEAMTFLATYAQIEHGRRGKSLAAGLMAHPRPAVERQALADLTQFVVRRHRARRRAA